MAAQKNVLTNLQYARLRDWINDRKSVLDGEHDRSAMIHQAQRDLPFVITPPNFARCALDQGVKAPWSGLHSRDGADNALAKRVAALEARLRIHAEVITVVGASLASSGAFHGEAAEGIHEHLRRLCGPLGPPEDVPGQMELPMDTPPARSSVEAPTTEENERATLETHQ